MIMDDLLKIIICIIFFCVICMVFFFVGFSSGQRKSDNKAITGHKIEVKYKTNSLGEVKIVSKNWVKNEK